MNRIDISTEEKKQEVYELFKNFKNKSQIHEYYGISDNSQGCNYIKEIADEIGFDLDLYKKKETRYCLECGAELKKGQTKFCCKSCAVAYNNRQRDKSVYEKVASKLRKSQKHNKKEDKYCVVCGKPLIGRQHKFCSKSCRNKYYYSNNGYEVVCVECGKIFKTTDSERRFCSNSCCTKYKQEKLIEEWSKGNLEINGNSGLCDSIRKFLFDKTKYKCQKCGFEGYNEVTGNTILQIHHKDGDCNNNTPENLEVLCPNCHAMTENYMGLNRGKSTRIKRYYK